MTKEAGGIVRTLETKRGFELWVYGSPRFIGWAVYEPEKDRVHINGAYDDVMKKYLELTLTPHDAARMFPDRYLEDISKKEPRYEYLESSPPADPAADDWRGSHASAV